LNNDEIKNKQITWIQNGLIVRVINKKLGNEYYLQKGYVYDIVSPFEFLLKMNENDNSRILKCHEEDVETVIPKNGNIVVILNGEFKGQKATLINTKKNTTKAICQLQSELDIIELGFNDICQC